MKNQNLTISTLVALTGTVAYLLVDFLVPSDNYKMGMAAFYQKTNYKEARRCFRKVPEKSEEYAGAQIQLKKLEPILYTDSVNEVFWEYMRNEQNRSTSDPGYQNR